MTATKMLLPSFSTRIYHLVVLSLFFTSATLLLWSGGHERFIPSFYPKPPPDVHDDAPEELFSPIANDSVNEELKQISGDVGGGLIMHEYDGAPIKEMCEKTSWNSSEDVVIGCGARVGGVGMLSCL
jgi:hypothetical protein